MIASIAIVSQSGGGESQPLTGGGDAEKTARLNEIYCVIYEGAESFLRAEYTVCTIFISVFSVVILVLVSWGTGWDFARGLFTAISFLLGALTSMVSYTYIRRYAPTNENISMLDWGWGALTHTMDLFVPLVTVHVATFDVALATCCCCCDGKCTDREVDIWV